MSNLTAHYHISGLSGNCGSHNVFLGFAPARLLCAVSFADVLDEDTGEGYQRPPNKTHSLDFKRYIGQPGASTIPLTFNLRGDLQSDWKIEYRSSGKTILHIREGTKCLAQVDCQHRLGELGDSDIPLAFMAFVGLSLRAEMAMFTVINSKAKGLSSSLTDFHTSNLVEDLAKDMPNLYLATRLNNDSNSPWHKLIRCGGKSTSGLKRKTSLRMMQHAIQQFLIQTNCLGKLDTEDVAQLLIAYWRAVACIFQSEWENHRSNLITKGVGLYGLMQLLSSILEATGFEKRTEDHFVNILIALKSQVDWGTHGTFRAAGGHKGAKQVHLALKGHLGI